MPDRYLRQGLRTSKVIGGLSDPAFRMYALLLTHHDDYGRFEAVPELLRVELFPYRIDRIRVADITRWLAECHDAGAIVLYGPASKPVGLVLKVEKPRNKSSRFPPPPPAIECWRESGKPPPDHAVFGVCAQLRADVDNCPQTPTVTVTVATTSNMPPKGTADPPEKPKARELPPATVIPPTLEMVKAYMPTIGMGSDMASRFIDFYESKGWMIGKVRMKNWQAACRTWKSMEPNFAGAKGKPRGTTSGYDQAARAADETSRRRASEVAALQKKPPPISSLGDIAAGFMEATT